jgi:hypothetical protein
MADVRPVTRAPARRNTPPYRTQRVAAMSGKRWRRAKTAKPTQCANVRFPKDDPGQRAKATYEAWRQNLTPSQKRSLTNRPARR